MAVWVLFYIKEQALVVTHEFRTRFHEIRSILKPEIRYRSKISLLFQARKLFCLILRTGERRLNRGKAISPVTTFVAPLRGS